MLIAVSFVLVVLDVVYARADKMLVPSLRSQSSTCQYSIAHILRLLLVFSRCHFELVSI